MRTGKEMLYNLYLSIVVAVGFRILFKDNTTYLMACALAGVVCGLFKGRDA
jgi:hypothetical protein